jgi:hypothetical protein
MPNTGNNMITATIINVTRKLGCERASPLLIVAIRSSKAHLPLHLFNRTYFRKTRVGEEAHKLILNRTCQSQKSKAKHAFSGPWIKRSVKWNHFLLKKGRWRQPGERKQCLGIGVSQLNEDYPNTDAQLNSFAPIVLLQSWREVFNTKNHKHYSFNRSGIQRSHNRHASVLSDAADRRESGVSVISGRPIWWECWQRSCVSTNMTVSGNHEFKIGLLQIYEA